MTNTSILSEKCNETGIYIQGNFKKGMCKSRMNGIDSKVVAKKGKVIVKTIFQTSGKNENLKEKLTYTIQKGDDKRLCREGVLRVYNIKEPIDIPIINLLGKWKNTHIGITLFVLNGQWYAGKEFVENLTYKQERGVFDSFETTIKIRNSIKKLVNYIRKKWPQIVCSIQKDEERFWTVSYTTRLAFIYFHNIPDCRLLTY